MDGGKKPVSNSNSKVMNALQAAQAASGLTYEVTDNSPAAQVYRKAQEARDDAAKVTAAMLSNFKNMTPAQRDAHLNDMLEKMGKAPLPASGLPPSPKK